MKQNKFVIITTVYNLKDWLPMNINMMKYQNFDNWHCVYIDDWSDDGSYEYLVEELDNDSRFTILRTEHPKSRQGAGFLSAIDHIQNELDDNDVIVEVDGDDWLSSVFVLDYLNRVYQNENIWMSYGQYQIYPTGQLGGHWNMDISDDVDSRNDYRSHPFPYSHLKTYKYWLFKKIDRKDLIDPTTNKVWASAWDHALCIPMVEMSGKNRIYRCTDILYSLNRSQELQNEGKTRLNEQKHTEQLIRKGKCYKRLDL